MKLILRVLQILTYVFCLVALAQIVSAYTPNEIPYVYWDSFGYFMNAHSLYFQPFLETIKGFENQYFGWWIPLVFSSLNLSIDLRSLVMIGHISGFCFLICGLWLFTYSFPAKWHMRASALMLIFMIPAGYLHQEPTALAADFYLAGYILFCAALLKRLEANCFESHPFAISAGLFIAAGTLTKPIFLFWAVPRLFFSACFCLFNRPKRSGVLLFSATLISTLIFLFPTKIFLFIQQQYKHNEVWKYYPSDTSISWFSDTLRSVASESGTIYYAVLMFVVFAIVCSVRSIFSSIRLRSIFKHTDALTVLSCLIFLTFFVNSKPLRAVLFVALLFLLCLCQLAFENFGNSNRKLLKWTCDIVPAIALTVLMILSTKKLHQLPIHFSTFNELGYPEVFSVLESVSKKDVPNRLFFAVSNRKYNNSGFDSYPLARCGLRPNLGECNSTFQFLTSSAVFRTGGWSYPGGIPMELFNSDFVLTMKEPIEGHLDGRVEFYNEYIQNKVASKDSNFMSFLAPLKEVPALNEDTWAILQRTEVRENAFFAIVNDLLEKDPDNIWNEPFRIALLKHESKKYDPFAILEVERRAKLLKDNSFDLESTKRGRNVMAVLNNDKNVIAKLTFPEMLKDLSD